MTEHQWHLDKRVPVALIFALMLQGAGGVWWASTANERLAQVERRLEAFSDRTETMQTDLAQQGRSVAVLLSRIEDTNRNLDRVSAEMAATNNLLRQLITNERDREGQRP